MSTTEDLIKQMYDSQLDSQTERLTVDHNAAQAELDARQQKNQQATDAALNRTMVESQKSAVNNAEYYAAAGLTSGAKAQARMAQDNQLQADLTAIRTAQQSADAQIEQERSLLSREFTAAIRQAQAENDLAKAQALYEEAKNAEAELLSKQEAAAKVMAAAGDYTRYGALYGLTDAEIAALQAAAAEAAPAPSAPLAPKQPEAAPVTDPTAYNNGALSSAQIAQLQRYFGADPDGMWGAASTAAAGGRTAQQAWEYYQYLLAARQGAAGQKAPVVVKTTDAPLSSRRISDDARLVSLYN